jgi:hypothetical protein
VLAAWLAPGAGAVPRDDPSARLWFFTEDGAETGALLYPGFRHHSLWSGLGQAPDGRIYLAVSNHEDPGGNVAVFAFDPGPKQMALVGDIEAVSSGVNNWISSDSQRKVHTFLLRHADGLLYFASMPRGSLVDERGAHVYTLDPETGTLVDFSKTQAVVMTETLTVIPNGAEPTSTSGVFIEEYGIKGLGLHPGAPDRFYAMTSPDGHLIRYDLDEGDMAVVGVSPGVSYVFHTDAGGNVYYTSASGGSQTLLKYVAATGATETVATGLPDGGIGAIAPSADGTTVYWLINTTQDIYELDTTTDTLTFRLTACGSNWWRLFNLHLSRDERSLYFVSNNNDRSTIRRIDLETNACTEVLDVDELLGSRDLAFGGVGIWDRGGSFYAPVWTNALDPPDLALLEVSVEEPLPKVPSLPGSAAFLVLLLGAAGARAIVLERSDARSAGVGREAER